MCVNLVVNHEDRGGGEIVPRGLTVSLPALIWRDQDVGEVNH